MALWLPSALPSAQTKKTDFFLRKHFCELVKRGFRLSVERHLRLLWCCIIRSRDWLKQLAPFSQPIKSVTKINRDLLARVFPR